LGHAIEQIGSYAGLAAFLGLGVFALLSFTQARDIRRLRDWAGSAPERDAERKEATSTIAAQRAEELRALEQARTAEHEAVENREVRRQRREEGLPELTRGERVRGSFSNFGERLGQPLVLVAIFVVCLLIAAGVIYAVTSGGDEGAKGNDATASAKVLKPAEIEVAVLNGTSVPGLAATYGAKVQAKGFKKGPVTNSSSTFESSVVMFKPGHKPEAELVGKRVSIPKTQPINGEIEGVAGTAPVAVVVGEDNAEAAE
jgi:hypothetical protein